MSPVIDFSSEEVSESSVINDGTETTLRITNAKKSPTKKGDKEGITLFFESVDYPESEDLMEWIEIPTAERLEEDPKESNRARRRLIALYECFGLEQSMEDEEFVGMTGDVIVTVRENETYGTQNKIQTFIKSR